MKSSGRRRIESGTVRRSNDLRTGSTRRFSRRKEAAFSDDAIPAPAHAGIPMKKRVLASRLRGFALCMFCLVLLSLFNSHQRRVNREQAHMSARMSRFAHSQAADESTEALNEDHRKHSRDSSHVDTDSTEKHDESPKDSEASSSNPSAQEGEQTGAEAASEGLPANTADDRSQVKEEPREDIPDIKDQIESITRTDMMAGAHPVCRISNACILANGVLSLPHWMSKDDRLLRQCGVGPHIFHPDTDGPRSSVVKHVDADLAHLIRLARFKEPASTMTEFFADSVLHSAFLFDTFHTVQDAEKIKSHCFSSSSGTECIPEGNDAGRASTPDSVLKPAMFVPRKVLNEENSWEAEVLSLFDQKYGADDLLRMQLDQVLDPAEKDRTSNVSATCFRSIMVSEGRLKDLPEKALSTTKSTFFMKNDIDRSPHRIANGESCSVSVGLLRKTGHRAVQNIEELKEKIESIASAALPSAHVQVTILDHNRRVAFKEQVSNLKDVDILVGGTSNSLNSMAFMREGGSVFEIFPFAWQPPNFGELARFLGLNYREILSSPQTTEFKTCLEHELFQLRKQNRLQDEETPQWAKDAEAKWGEAAGDFVLTGKSQLLMNTDASGVSNYHTRACARRQSLSFSVDDLAKAVLLDARNICHPKSA